MKALIIICVLFNTVVFAQSSSDILPGSNFHKISDLYGYATSPVADFTTDKTHISIGEIVQFTDISLNEPKAWYWEFEGGTPSSSTEANPQVSYLEKGVFKVKLEVSNDSGSDILIKDNYIWSVCDDLNYSDDGVGYGKESYTDLDDTGMVIYTQNFDDANSEPIEIGFEFEYNCLSYSHFILNTNGFIKLGVEAPSSEALYFDTPNGKMNGLFESTEPEDKNIISIFNHDLEGGINPEYRVHTSGLEPNRICTIQFEGIKDKNDDIPCQYDDIQFQIKLHESSNIIKFVYGEWTFSGNAKNKKSAAVGLKGSSNKGKDILTASKYANHYWYSADFHKISYTDALRAFNFHNSFSIDNPTPGRTFIFRPKSAMDISVDHLYCLSKASNTFSNPQVISVYIKNRGYKSGKEIKVTLKITGENPFHDEKIISDLAADAKTLVNFDPYFPMELGTSNLKIFTENDDYNPNNKSYWDETVTENMVNYSPDWYYHGSWGIDNKIFLTRYFINNAAKINSVDAFIYAHPNNPGQTVYGVIMNESGNILASSAPYVLTSDDNGKIHSFPIIDSTIVTDKNILVGLALTPSYNNKAYFANAYQSEIPGRENTYYWSNLDGSNLIVMPGNNNQRYNIGLTLSPYHINDEASAAEYNICEGNNTDLSFSEDYYQVQWQVSENGLYGWTDVTSGIGGVTSNYTTPPLYSDTYYRVKVYLDQEIFVYSNIVPLIIKPNLYNEETKHICEGDDYTFPDGTMITNISQDSIYISSLESIFNCDSIIKTTLIVHQSFHHIEEIKICKGDSYTFPDGEFHSDIQTPIDHKSYLFSEFGCDSVIETSLIFYPDYYYNDTISICTGNDYTFPDETTIQNISEELSHSSYLKTINGCDSIIEILITLFPDFHIAESITICPGENYIFPDGDTSYNIQESLLHSSFLSSVQGCDSIIETAVLVHKIDLDIEVSENTIAALNENTTYQWIHCDDNFAIISDEVQQFYTPFESGNYAVILNDSICKDTTECVYVTGTNLEFLQSEIIRIWPNPSSGYIYIESDGILIETIEIFTTQGVKVTQKLFNNTTDISFKMDLNHLSCGPYLVVISSSTGKYRMPIVID